MIGPVLLRSKVTCLFLKIRVATLFWQGLENPSLDIPLNLKGSTMKPITELNEEQIRSVSGGMSKPFYPFYDPRPAPTVTVSYPGMDTVTGPEYIVFRNGIKAFLQPGGYYF